MSHAPPSRDTPQSISLTILGVAAFILGITARSYLSGGAPYGDDNSSHLAWMLHITEVFRSGRLDFYFGQQNLGVPMFVSYHPLPGLLMGVLHWGTASFVDAITLFKGSIVILWMGMPLAWYTGGRWMGMSRTEALALGLLSLGIQDLHNYGLTIQSVLYKGLYAQLYGMFFLPLTLGSLYRYLILEEGTPRAPIVLFWLTFLSHAFFGIYVGIASFLMLGVKLKGTPRRFVKLLLVYSVTLLLLLFWVVPLLHHVHHVGGLPWKTEIQNGYPWKTTIQHFIQGMLFDERRWPWLTVLVSVGLVLSILRIQHRLTRWLLLTTIVTSAMYLGRTFWGSWYGYVPLHRELNVGRYLSGLHFCGLMLAALALATLLRWAQEQVFFPKVADFTSKFSVFLIIPLCGFYLYHRTQHWQSRLKTFTVQESSFHDMTLTLHKGRGRYVASSSLGTTSHFNRDLLAALSQRPHLRSFGMTFHATLSNYYLDSYDFNATLSRLYNVRYLLTKNTVLSRKRQRDFKPVLQSGHYRLYQARHKYGYFGFVHVPLTVHGSAKTIRKAVQEITPKLFHHNMLPLLSLHEPSSLWKRWFTSQMEPTPLQPQPLLTSANLYVTSEGKETLSLFGKVRPLHQTTTAQLQRWIRQQKFPVRSKVISETTMLHSYHATVEVKQRQDILLLKVNYFPYWQAYRGNIKIPIYRIAPNFMAVMLPKGIHRIHFEYRNPSIQKILFLLSLLWVLLIAFRGLPRLTLRRSTPNESKSPEQRQDVDPVATWIQEHYGTSKETKPKP